MTHFVPVLDASAASKKYYCDWTSILPMEASTSAFLHIGSLIEVALARRDHENS